MAGCSSGQAPDTTQRHVPRIDHRYLEDLAVGDTFSSPEYEITADQIIAYAQEFDPQPFYTDPVAAKDTFFAGLAASGWHTASVTMKLIVASAPFAHGIIGAGGELSWPAPTRPGEILNVDSEILKITPSGSKPQGLVQIESVTLNHDGETRQRLTANLVVPRRRDDAAQK